MKRMIMFSILSLCLASTASDRMAVAFDGANELKAIRVGRATFATGGGDLWTAEFSSGTNRAQRVTVRAAQATARTARETAVGIELAWRGLPLGDEPAALDAVVTIAKRADGSQAWSLRFANRSATWALLSTDFPRLNRVARDGEADVMLPWKDHGARLFKARRGEKAERRFPYLGYFPQVAAAFIGGDGLYFAAEDPDARQKTLIVSGEQNLTIRTPVEWGGVVGRAAEGPRHDVVLAPLEGDWWAAARRYRAFAVRQKWCAKGPIAAGPCAARRLAEIPLWINAHASPAQVSNVLSRAKELFPSFATGLHWHLWQHSGHDVNYPEYFPEQPGTRDCLVFCAGLGQEPMPYTNGRLWSASTSGYLMAEPYAVMDARGRRDVEKYAPWTPPLAVMCPACPAWRRVIAGFSGRVLDELGAKSIFIDQIGAAGAKPCYDPSHPHPAGGGGWWYDGYAAALAPIRAAYNARGAFLTTEGSGEAYVGLVDGFLQVVARTPEDVPFLNAVYSGYTTYFGSSENNDDSPTAFRALQTRELLWGNALGWFLPDVLDRPDKCAILRQLCEFRQDHLDCLAYGTLLDELRVVSPLGRTTCEWLGRRPHFRLFDKTFKLPPSQFATLPDVIGAWWRNADGARVLLAANLTDRPQRVTYRVFGGDATASLALAPHALVAVPAAGNGAAAAERDAAASYAVVRILKGAGAKTARVVETRRVPLETVSATRRRVTIEKGTIPADAFAVEVVPPFMMARKGERGYWVQARGTYGAFDRDVGAYVRERQLMPIYGMKKGDTLWAGHVKTWRFDYDFVTVATNDAYETFPRFRCDRVRRYFAAPYNDIVVDFLRLDGAEADYNGLARAYRAHQLSRGAVRTIKSRLKAQPELDYLCDAIVVRLQTHASKPIPDRRDGYTQENFEPGRELPVEVHLPFDVAEEYLQAFRDAGIDKLSFCSAGWGNGGYDGRVPGHFPVCAEAGGETAFRRLVAKAKDLGYQFAVHCANTDGYTCSPMWDAGRFACRTVDGRLDPGGLWGGGRCYWMCQRCAWEKWTRGEMDRLAAMGIRGPHYIDVYSATYPARCGSAEHPCTPEQTAEFQNRILAYARQKFGAAASESGYDHVIGNIDYINYIERDLKTEHEGGFDGSLVSGVFPLWELVYHGIVLYTSDRLTQNHTRGKCLFKLERSGDPRWMVGDGVEDPYVALKMVEFGGRPIFYTYKFADVQRVRKAWDEFVPVRHLQRELMVAHRQIAPKVYETLYGNGERTVCDYNAFTVRLIDKGGKEKARMNVK